ncbi:MAG: ABC transporter permease [Bacteroidota bacterium]
MNHPIPQPPRWADRLLSWFCRPELLEEIQGDLHELFELRCQEKGPGRAKLGFIWDVCRSARLSTVRFSFPIQRSWMWRSHFRVAYRQLRREKFHSFINLGGLSLGIAATILMLLFIQHETQFDQGHPRSEDLYRVLGQSQYHGEESRGVHHNPPLAEVLVKQYQEIEMAFRVRSSGSRLVRTADQTASLYEEHFLYADSQMLKMLSMPLLYGRTDQALRAPFSVLLTEEKAQRYFPGEDPIGKVLIFNQQTDQPFTVTGVIADQAAPTHIRADFILSMSTLSESQSGSWNISSYPTYIRLKPGVDPVALAEKMQEVILTHKKDMIASRIAAGGTYGYRFQLQPIQDIYLHSQEIRTYDSTRTGDIRYVWLSGAIAAFVLLIAMINFVNLTTAKSALRIREMGIRKVLGSRRRQLVGQFLAESILLSLLATFLGACLAWMVFPYFADLTHRPLSFPVDQLTFYGGLAMAGLLIGFCAGAYPALFLSGVSPLESLKSTSLSRPRKVGLRSVLVVGQFAASILLMMATLLIFRQMDFIQHKSLGYDKSQVVIVEDEIYLRDKREAFRQSLQQLPAIQEISASSFVPVEGYVSNGSTVRVPDTTQEIREIDLRRWHVDAAYLPTLGMRLLAGRNFQADLAADSASILLNETAVRQLGFTLDNVLGKMIEMRRPYYVIGVVEDFHFRSMRQEISALAFHHTRLDRARNLLVKVQGKALATLLPEMEARWKAFSPEVPFRYAFLDEQFERMYETERSTGSLLAMFAGLAIFIACLGLLALATYLAEKRSREMSIRKVLGATVEQVFAILTRDLLKLLAVALLLAIPIGLWWMQGWLENFAYKINLSADLFLLPGIAAFLIALGTISYQAWKVAHANPADALRDE